MSDLTRKLLTAERGAVLVFMACAIHDGTISGRWFYDQPHMAEGLRQTNERIHRLSAHLRDLMDPSEPMTDSRAEAIAELASGMPAEAIDRAWERSGGMAI